MQCEPGIREGFVREGSGRINGNAPGDEDERWEETYMKGAEQGLMYRCTNVKA